MVSSFTELTLNQSRENSIYCPVCEAYFVKHRNNFTKHLAKKHPEILSKANSAWWEQVEMLLKGI